MIEIKNLNKSFSEKLVLNDINLVIPTGKVFGFRNDDRSAVQKRLDEITRTVRFELAGRMNQKYVPDIKFQYDDTLEKAMRIDELLNNL